MFIYEKKLQYPIKIANPNPRLAKIIISQYGGPDGELGASLRYLSQRFSMPCPELKGLLTDIGTAGSKSKLSAEKHSSPPWSVRRSSDNSSDGSPLPPLVSGWHSPPCNAPSLHGPSCTWYLSQ